MATIGKTFALILLSISISSYGMIGMSYSQEGQCGPGTQLVNGVCCVFQGGQCVDVETVEHRLGLEISANTYSSGDPIRVTGNVGDVLNRTDVTIIIQNSDKNVVAIAQITPIQNGSYSHEFLALGPLWAAAGTYNINATYGDHKDFVTFSFSGSSTAPPPPPTPDPDPEPIERPDPEPEPPVEPPEPPTEPEPPVEPPEPPTEPEPPVEPPESTCPAGQQMVNGECVPIADDTDDGGGCLIATAAFGSELAPQVQFLRELRDNTVLSTASGTSFMAGFNTLYYSFSPTIADWERESPAFKEAVKAAITPMLTTLNIMSLADEGSESSVLALGISVIALNIGMYIAAPAFAAFGIRKYLKSRN